MNPSPRHPAQKSASVVLLIGILAVSTASLFIRFAQQDAPSIVIAAYRLTLATVFLLPFALPRFSGEVIRALKKKDVFLIILSGTFLAIHFASWITSLEHTTVASSVVLVTTTPLWVAMFSGFILKESIPKWTWLGLGLAMIGGIVVGLSSQCGFWDGGFQCQDLGGFFSSKNLLGNFLALLGAWMAAGYLISGRKVRPRFHLQVYVFLIYGVASILLLAMVGFRGYSLTGYSPQTYVWFVLLAIIPQLIGHTVLNWALGYLPATFVSVALLGEPVGTVILSYLFLREAPTFLELAGGILILAGIYISSRMDAGKME